MAPGSSSAEVPQATWCFYACDPNLALEEAKKDVESDLHAEERHLRGELAHYAHANTEKVRLHLRLHG